MNVCDQSSLKCGTSPPNGFSRIPQHMRVVESQKEGRKEGRKGWRRKENGN
jgi:hypothetical protein